MTPEQLKELEDIIREILRRELVSYGLIEPAAEDE